MTDRPVEKVPPTPSGATPRKARTPRVFLGPVEIAGYYTALGRGLRNIGIPATAIDLREHPFKYGDELSRAPQVARPAIFARRMEARGGRAATFWKVASRAARLPLFVWALWHFDVFVFGFGESFFRLYDLPVLKMCGKRIVMVSHGSDLRPPYMDGPTMGGGSSRSIADCMLLTRQLKRRARTAERHADVIVSHPLFSHFLERPYVRFLAVGLPVQELPAEVPTRTSRRAGIRVLHSPSDTAVKGTLLIREAVDQVIAEGVEIEYVEVSGQPNAVVLRELQLADVVIDQLYSDTPMAGFAAEAASVGCPVIVGSCDWEEIRRAMPVHEIGPVRACDAEHLAEAIRTLATDPTARHDLGDRARAFAVERVDSTQVAKRFREVILGSIPLDWFSDPADCRHLCGAGLPAERVREVVRDLVSGHGRASLELADKPLLEARMVQWASAAPADATVLP